LEFFLHFCRKVITDDVIIYNFRQQCNNNGYTITAVSSQRPMRCEHLRSDSSQLNSVADVLKIFRTWRLTRNWPEMSCVEFRRIANCVHSARSAPNTLTIRLISTQLAS